MVSELSDAEKETAARTSFSYYKMTKTATADLRDARNRAAMAMAARHLKAEKGDVAVALEKMRATIHWRREKRMDLLRDCFEDHSPEALEMREKIMHYIGNKGKLVVTGFDKQHRACWHTVGRHSPEGSQFDHEGCLMSHNYMLERALACSEARSLKHTNKAQEMVIVSVDFGGFKKSHAPLLGTVKAMLYDLRDHYPERLFRVYFVDAPILFRGLWSAIKPFLDPDTKAKFQFVTGHNQRLKVFNEEMGAKHCMPYQHPEGKLPENVNLHEFWQLPFDVAYGDNPTGVDSLSSGSTL